MYLPAHFRETDPERISALVEGHPFGLLITAPDGAPFASHLPLMFERSAEAPGRLLGHMARANPQWQHLAADARVLAVFQGPHAYVSPSWYLSPGVPTWNYAAVHVHGNARLIESEDELEALLERLTHVHESGMPNPWKPTLAGEQRARLLSLIVGFEIEITEVEAKFKLGQNRTAEDRQRVADELSRSKNASAVALAALMKEKGA